MSNGPELMSLLDSDLLEYSNTLEGSDRAVNAWRALCNLQERVSLLALHAGRQAARHAPAAERFEAVRAQLAAIETGLAADLAALRPASEVLAAAIDTHDGAPALSPQARQAQAAILRGFLAEGGRLVLPAGDALLEPLLRGFHHGEDEGRWSGPFTTSAILLPLGTLRDAGVAELRLRMDQTALFDIATLRVFLGTELAEDAAPLRVGTTELVIELGALKGAPDRLVVSIPRTRRIGEDRRLLGFRLASIILEAADAG